MRKTTFSLCMMMLLLPGVILPSTAAAADKLSERQKAIIPIAAFTANGDSERLRQALAAGLNNSLSVNDIKEILIQMYAYSGFPRSLTGHGVFMDLLKEREQRGIRDPAGQEPAQPAPDADKRTMGGKIQTELVGRPVSSPIYEFSPAMDAFLKEHLFYDIFSRGVLNNQERELATVSALAALPAPAQLASHLNVCLNTGLTPAQLRDFVSVLSKQVGKKEADLASGILEKISKKE